MKKRSTIWKLSGASLLLLGLAFGCSCPGDDINDDDGDGIPNVADADHPYNAGKPDTDSDGIIDEWDADVDGDGVIDNGPDADGDGIKDTLTGGGGDDGVDPSDPDSSTGDGTDDGEGTGGVDESRCSEEDCRRYDEILREQYGVPGGVVGVPDYLADQYPDEETAEANDGDGFCLGYDLETGYYYFPCDDGRPGGSGPAADDPRYDPAAPGNNPSTPDNPIDGVDPGPGHEDVLPPGQDPLSPYDPGLGIPPGTCWPNCFPDDEPVDGNDPDGDGDNTDTDERDGEDPQDGDGDEADGTGTGSDPDGDGDTTDNDIPGEGDEPSQDGDGDSDDDDGTAWEPPPEDDGEPPFGEDPPGNFDGDDPPTQGQCGDQRFSSLVGDPQVLIVLDRSNSMTENFTSGGQRWDAVTSAIEEVLVQGENIDFGLALFPSSSFNQSNCPTSGYTIQQACTVGDVDVEVGPNGASQVSTMLGSTVPCGGTPMSGTLSNVVDSFDDNTGGRKLLVLATDGGPNCNVNAPACSTNDCTNPQGQGCGSGGTFNCLQDIAAANAVDELRAAGVETYVMGIDGSGSFAAVLNEMAIRGGTAKTGDIKYYPVGSEQEMVDQLGSIIDGAGACILTLDNPIDKDRAFSIEIGGQVLNPSEYYYLGHNQVGIHNPLNCNSELVVNYCY